MIQDEDLKKYTEVSLAIAHDILQGQGKIHAHATVYSQKTQKLCYIALPPEKPNNSSETKTRSHS